MILVTGVAIPLSFHHSTIPFSFPDADFSPLLVGALSQVLVRNPLWPPDVEDIPKPAVNEGLKFGDNPFSQSRRLTAILEERLYVGIKDPQLCPQRDTLLSPDGSQNIEGSLCLLAPVFNVSSVSSVVVIRLPRYVKAVTCSRTLPV